MKKILTAAVLGALVLSIGCSSNTSSSKKTESTTTTTTTDPKR